MEKFIGWALVCGAVAVARGEQALNPPVPLLPDPAGASPAVVARTWLAANDALRLGLASQAADLYRQLLRLPGTDRREVTLSLATALLSGGQPAEAEEALASIPEPHSASWQLRAALAALQLKKYEAVRAALGPNGSIKEAELPATDYPWYWFFEGAYVDIFSPAQEQSRADNFYARAENAAGGNELARARFQLAREEFRLRRGATQAGDLKVILANYEGHQGQPISYSFAINYAMAADAVGATKDAVAFLQQVLLGPPIRETDAWDRVRLVLGLLDGRGRGFAGRRALLELVEGKPDGGSDPARQRQALQLLWDASQTEPARSQLRALLEKLTAPGSKHPILESLLYYRAQLALLEKKYDDVAREANELLEKFPASSLRVQTLGLLTELAWEQRRYRTAAENARKARAQLANAEDPALVAARAELTLVEAEAQFRAGVTAGDPSDFRSAADAYEAALQERPANVKPGDLMFQRVLAEIKAGSSDAGRILDEKEKDPAFDPENRWQAEWSLARALLTREKTAEAYGRVTKLLGETPAAGVSAELHARMAWLQVRLSLEANQPAQTIPLVDALLATPPGINAALWKEIASTSLLRKAEAQFRLERESAGPKSTELETAALGTLQKVRTAYPDSDAAIQTYLVEAKHYADSDRIQKAQETLTALTENPAYRENSNVPYAYYQLALLSERLGQTKDFGEAIRRIEAMMDLVREIGKKNPAAAAAQANIVFAARMKQGELLRRLNQFAQAQQIYERLTVAPASPENEIFAKLALAQTHNAQAAADAAHAESAQLLFAELTDRLDAPADVRVEAGYNLGALLSRQGKLDEAARVWWRDVVTPFLIEDQKREDFGATRPYWLSRTLFDLGALYEQQQRFSEARRAYELIATGGLGFAEASARKALERLRVPSAKPSANVVN